MAVSRWAGAAVTPAIVAAIFVGVASGCCANKATTSAAERCFREAHGKDLRLSIPAMEHGADGFPVVVVQLSNLSADDVIVAYQKGTIEVHCGPYVQYGPFSVDSRRREILDGHGWVQFPPPRGRWTLSSTRGAELMVPTKLESGDYPMWASFRLASGDHAVVQTTRQMYSVP